MKKLYFLILFVIPSLSFAQWQYVNPNVLGSTGGSTLLQTSVVGQLGTNSYYNNLWLYRSGSGNDWATTQLVNGISVDVSFQTPFTSRSWWRRDPYYNVQSWGDQGNTYMTINNGNVGIGTTSPSEKMHISGSFVNDGLGLRIENTDNNFASFASIQFKTGASSSIWQAFARNGDLFLGIANVADYIVIKNSGRLQIDNNLVENAVRPIAIGRKNYLFAGSHDGARRAAMLYSFMGTCKKNNVNPFEWLKDILIRMPSHRVNKLEQLLPNNWVKSAS
jgi:hypothetical protein